jgi:hypothetical protein
MFDKKEMVDWENKSIAIKEDYDEAKIYFKNVVKDFKTYTQNSGGTAEKQGYESANMAAEVGNKLWRYIQEIAWAAAADKESAANINKLTKSKDAQMLAIIAQIKMLMDAVAALNKSFKNKENASANTGNANQGSQPCQFNWPRNMGAYCWSHGPHPAGAKHASNTCTKKKEGHIDNSTAMDQKGRYNF